MMTAALVLALTASFVFGLLVGCAPELAADWRAVYAAVAIGAWIAVLYLRGRA